MIDQRLTRHDGRQPGLKAGFSSIGLIWVIVLGLTAGCGAPQGTGSTERPESGEPPNVESWQQALFPYQRSSALWAERWGRHIALYAGGRVYASNGEDVPTSVAAPLYPLVLRDQPHKGRTWAVIGIASGIELGVALSSSPERVDLYEPPTNALVRAGWVLSKGLGRPLAQVDRFHQATHLKEVSHLRFVDGQVRHERLRVLQAPPASRPSYDIIVHSTGLNVLSQPYRLYRTDRLEALRDLLNPGGRLVLHLQLYEIRPETLHNLLRTFAEVFPYMTVMVSEDLSSDTLVIGSNQSLAVHLPRARAVAADPEMQYWLEQSKLTRPSDFAARTILANRVEVLAYTGGSKRVYTKALPMAPEELPLRVPNAPGSPDEEAWDRAYEQFQEEQGIDDRFVATFYRPEWSFGDPCPAPPDCRFFRGVGQGENRQTALAELTLSLIAHGKLDMAEDLMQAAENLGGGPPVTRARRVFEIVHVQASPPVDLAELVGDHPLRPTLEGILRTGNEGGTSVARQELETLRSSGQVPPELQPAVEFLSAYLLCTGYQQRDGAAELRGLLAENEAFGQEYPEAWLYLARCLRQDYDMAGAVSAAERYVDLRPEGTPGGSP